MWAEHVPGKLNIAADSLSRNMMQVFHSNFPTANKEGTRIPQALLDLLVLQQPDWLSASWREKFRLFSTVV